MEERKWEDLEMDCLVNVFARVGMESLLLHVPLVCKSWYKATLNPLCWKCLDFFSGCDPWFLYSILNRFKDLYGIKDLSTTAFMKSIVDRSSGNATKLVLPKHGTEEVLKYAANECSGLEILGLHCSVFRDQLSIIPELIGKWKKLEGLILGSASVYIKFDEFRDFEAYITKEEASAIVILLPKIKYLTLLKISFDQETLVIILQGCKELVSLEVSDCDGFVIDEKILEHASQITTFKYKVLFNCRSAGYQP